jgi:lipoprotein-anchoring transpeptidase ErfK/SrfK
VGGKARIAILASLAALLAAAVGAYAWDTAEQDQIVQGIRIDGISVGGLSADQARHRLNKDLVAPLEQPVTVKFEGRNYVLSPERLQLRADLDGMVDEALAASREGGLPVRLWRYATGGEVDREIAPRISYSADALDGFVAEVSDAIDRAPQDATVEPSPDSLNLVEGQDGLNVRTGQLRDELEAAIGSPHDRVVSPKVDRVKPQVTTDQLAGKYPVYLTVDRAAFQLRLWKDLKLAKTYTIAVGQAGLETPAGLYSINDKQVNPSWHVPDSAWAGDLAGKVIPPGPADPLKARWMGFYDGAGVHGTDDVASLGTAASHGCIRMAIPDVIELYDQVPLGTPIYVG